MKTFEYQLISESPTAVLITMKDYETQIVDVLNSLDLSDVEFVIVDTGLTLGFNEYRFIKFSIVKGKPDFKKINYMESLPADFVKISIKNEQKKHEYH